MSDSNYTDDEESDADDDSQGDGKWDVDNTQIEVELHALIDLERANPEILAHANPELANPEVLELANLEILTHADLEIPAIADIELPALARFETAKPVAGTVQSSQLQLIISYQMTQMAAWVLLHPHELVGHLLHNWSQKWHVDSPARTLVSLIKPNVFPILNCLRPSLSALLALPKPTMEEMLQWNVYINILTDESGVVVGVYVGYTAPSRKLRLYSQTRFYCHEKSLGMLWEQLTKRHTNKKTGEVRIPWH